MQDETQNPSADPAREASVPDPSAANPVEAEGLNDTPSRGTVEQAGGEGDMLRSSIGPDPMEEFLGGDVWGTPPDAPAPDPGGTPPSGMVEQEEGPPPFDVVGGLPPLEPSAFDPYDWGESYVSDENPFLATPFDWLGPPVDEANAPDPSGTTGMIVDPVLTDQVQPPDSETAATPFPEAVSMPHDKIVEPAGQAETTPGGYDGSGIAGGLDLDGNGVFDQTENNPEVAAPPLNLAEQIDPNWPVLEELNSRELMEVQDLLGDPSRLSDPQVLEDLNPHQMQVVMQALVGHVSTPEPDVTEGIEDVIQDSGLLGDPDEGGEVYEPGTGVIPEDALIQEPETGVVPDADAGGEVYEPGTGDIWGEPEDEIICDLPGADTDDYGGLW